jgi:hypothetical protein
MEIKRVVVVQAGRTKWYKELIGTMFDVEIEKNRLHTHLLVNNDFNLNNLIEMQHKNRLTQDRMGIAIKDCRLIEISSNAGAKSLLSKEY